MLSDSEMHEAAEQFPKRGGGTLIAWSAWNYTEKEMLKILESVCAWTGRRTEWPFPSFILWIIKLVLLKDFNIHVKNFTYLFLYFEVFSFFFFNQNGNVTEYIKWHTLYLIKFLDASPS